MVTMVKAAYSKQGLSRECRESPAVIALNMSNVHCARNQRGRTARRKLTQTEHTEFDAHTHTP